MITVKKYLRVLDYMTCMESGHPCCDDLRELPHLCRRPGGAPFTPSTSGWRVQQKLGDVEDECESLEV